MADHITRFVSDANLACSLVYCRDCTQLIGHDQHGLQGKPLRMAAECMTTALLLATRLKGPGMLTYQLDTEGLLASMRIDAIGLGQIRALVPERVAQDLSDWNGFDTLIGDGKLSIAKRLAGQEQAYNSVLELQSGSPTAIANRYLRDSEQVSARLLLDVRGEESALQQAIGLYIELLPGGELEQQSEAIQAMLTDEEYDLSLDGSLDDQALIDSCFPDSAFRPLHDYTVSFHCPCSRDRYIETLSRFSSDQLKDLTNGEGIIETTCDFCKSRYDIPLDEVI